MTKDQIVQALMFYAPQAKWEIVAYADPADVAYREIAWLDAFYIMPTEVELQEHYDASVRAYVDGANYKFERKSTYPSVEEQLDMIYHHGVDVWKARIQAVKDSIPKP